MRTLDKHIEEKDFSNIYVIFGEEEHLKNTYEEKLVGAIISEQEKLMNFTKFEGKNTTVQQIIDASDTMPFMSERRVVLIKNSSIFYEGRKNDSKIIGEYVKNIPSSTILIFIDAKIDKRLKIFKDIKDISTVVEINNFSENELVEWITNIFKENNKYISSKEVVYMIRNIGFNMETLLNEINKLISYKSDEHNITIQDIDNICTKSVESKIFELTDAMFEMNVDVAIAVYKNLIFNKVSPFLVLNMMSRQFRIILQVKYLSSEKYNIVQIAKELSLKEFIVKDALFKSKDFTYKMLLQALNEFLEIDNKIKTGKISSEMAVEMLIIKYSCR